MDKLQDNMKEAIWKWRCKIAPHKELALEKPLDFESIDEKDGAAPPAKNTTFGADATIKTMYEGRGSREGHYEWVDYPPKQMSKSTAMAHDRVAIKAYKIKDPDRPSVSGRSRLKYHMIEVQNPLLLAALGPIVKKEGVLIDSEPVEFRAPFGPLWFCQDDIARLHKTTDTSDPLKQYLELFLRLLDDMFGELKIKRRHQLASGLIEHKSAWILFPRGSIVYTHGFNSESLCQVISTSYDQTQALNIKAKVLTFDGREYVWREMTLEIPPYEGKKLVTDLSHYPLEYHPRKDEIMKRLVARGKKALEFQSLRYCTYEGIALRAGEQGIEKHNVEGRILVDVVGYNRYHLAQGKRENDHPRIERINRAQYMEAGGYEQPNPDDGPRKVKPPKTQGRRLTEDEELKNKEMMLAREENLCFISELIQGYALKNKEWVMFFVEDIEPMVWNEEAYSHLVYDEQQKDLVLSFVENHKPRAEAAANHAPVKDVILGKGQGLIILLSGPPGTGKTLTAEAVADRTRRPLFYLQAEDLGINAATLGANIKRIFEMATDWDAVVLLDEADVFMAERNPVDLHRNELVSIFLRELEYYRGIVFLTTNLFGTIDSAFRSRVSLHLRFQALSREARESVWRKFLCRLPGHEYLGEAGLGKEAQKALELTSSGEQPLDDGDLRELSLWLLNGREIKNAIKMVGSWCSHKGYALTKERLESGIRVTTPHASKDGEVDNDLYD